MDKLIIPSLILGILKSHVLAVPTFGDQKWVSFCKGDTAKISCEAGKVIVITSARYGGFPDVMNPCSNPISSDCQEEWNVIREVQNVCFRKNSCSFGVDQTWDFCTSSPYLHMKISYVCTSDSVFHDLCTKLDRNVTSGFLVSPNYPASAQNTNTSKQCNVTLAMRSRHHVISFAPLDVRVAPGYMVRKCGMVFYINLRQNKNLDHICKEITTEVSFFGGEAAHVFTSIHDQSRGELYALVHFQNNAMIAFELCQRRTVTNKRGIIISPSVTSINEGCIMEIRRSPDEEIVLKFLRKDVSQYVEITKCDHALIIANTNQYQAKMTPDCIPNQVVDVFSFPEYTQLTFVASSADKVEIEYMVAKARETFIEPSSSAEPKKDWMIILIVFCAVFAVAVIVLLVVCWKRRSSDKKKPHVAKGTLHMQEKSHTVSYTPPAWANKNKDKDGYSTTKSRDSSMILPESEERVWRDNPTCSTSDRDYSKYQNVTNPLNVTFGDNEVLLSCDEQYTFDISVFTDSLAKKWNLVCDRKWLIGLVGTITMAGFLFGSITGGYTADRYGRRPALIVMAYVKVASNILAIFSPYYSLFCVARFIVGFSTTACFVIGYVLSVELVGSRHRNTYGIAYAALYSFGFMYLPLAAYVTRHYLTFQVAAVVPMLLMLLYPCVITESPRWLLLQGRKAEAQEICRKIASVNGTEIPKGFSFEDGRRNKNDVDTAQVSPKAITMLFATPKMRMRTSILFVDWFTVCLIFYALSLNAGVLVGDIFLNMFLLGFVEIPANLILMWSINVKCLGRKKSHAISFLIAGFACLLCVPVMITQKALWLSTVFAIIGKAGSSAAFNGLFLYTSELYPTRIRNFGVGVCGLMARISGMMASFAGGSLGDVWRPLPSLLFGVLGTTSGLLTFLLPETLGKKLPDTLDDIEGNSVDESQTDDFHEMESASNGIARKPETNQNGFAADA